MDPWFKVEAKDVIALLERRKDGFPWGNFPDEKYRCLVFWDDGVIRMTVNEFYKTDAGSYECLLFYTTVIGTTIEDYTGLTDAQLASKAYNAWCTGAR